MLSTQIKKDMMEALKIKDKAKKEVLTMVVSGIANKRIERKKNLDELEEIEVIAKEIKQIKETIKLTPKNRIDLIKENEYKIQVLQAYLPAQMSEDSIRYEIESILKELKIDVPCKSDRGKIMKILMAKVKGRADGTIVSKLVGSYIL